MRHFSMRDITRQTSAIFLFLIFTSLSSITLGTSLSIRTPKDDSKPIDFEVESLLGIDSLFALEVEFERQDGKYYRNLELFAWQYWKCLQFSGKYIDIQEDELNNISVDARYKNGTHSIGIAQTWDLRPETMLVAGEDIRWNFGIPYLIPIEFRAITNFYTSDFRKFNNETEVMFVGKLSSVLNIYYRYKSRYYDDYNFSMKTGIEVKL